MPRPFKLCDIGEALRCLPEDGSAQRHLLLKSPYSTWHLLRIPGGEKADVTPTRHEESTLLAIEGHATARIDARRQSLGPGQLIQLDPGAELELSNETTRPFVGLLQRCPPPSEGPEDPAAPID